MNNPTRILFVYAMPKGTDYLDKIKEEIDYIKLRILDGYNSRNRDYTTNTYDHIDINNFDTVIHDFQPDIVHFTGHGTKSGLVFQYGDPITAQQLKDLFRGKNPIQLLFLNACYSYDRFQTLLKIRIVLGTS